MRAKINRVICFFTRQYWHNVLDRRRIRLAEKRWNEKLTGKRSMKTGELKIKELK